MMGNGMSQQADSTMAFLSGLFVGLITGLLCAPQPGRQTREQVADYAGRASESLKEAGQQVKQSIDRLAQKRGRQGTSEEGHRSSEMSSSFAAESA